MSHDLVDKVAHEHADGFVAKCRHVPIWSWKGSNVAHVEVRLVDRPPLYLVFKDASYRPRAYPAIAGLEHPIGRPEALIYREAEAEPFAYSPRVLYFEDDPCERRQAVLLEDLTQSHHPVYSERDKKVLLEAMPEFHEKLGSRLGTYSGDDLVVYDRTLVEDVLDHARRGLDGLANEPDLSFTAEIRDLWPSTSAYLLDDRKLSRRQLRPIHGDFNTGNAFRGPHGDLKLVDWEWSGFGTRHDDVASLLKTRNARLEARAIDLLSNLEPSLTREEHYSLFWWSRLFTLVRDAALLTNQYLGLAEPAEIIRVRAFSLWQSLLRTQQELSGPGNEWVK